jgi:hypothetical protein
MAQRTHITIKRKPQPTIYYTGKDDLQKCSSWGYLQDIKRHLDLEHLKEVTGITNAKHIYGVIVHDEGMYHGKPNNLLRYNKAYVDSWIKYGGGSGILPIYGNIIVVLTDAYWCGFGAGNTAVRQKTNVADIKLIEHEYVCCFCHVMKPGHGNNASPVKDGEFCCDWCNTTKVMPERLSKITV